MLHSGTITYAYPGGTPLNFPALSLGKGESLLILGASGSGKTTWLQLLAGVLKPQSGAVWINGQDLTQLSARALDRFRAEEISIVFQEHHFIPSLNAEDNLRVSLRGREFPTDRCRELAILMGLNGFMHRRPAQLSQGERQRLSLLRAFLKNPSLILADEPSSGLDDRNAEMVISLLKQEAEHSDCTLIIVTHDQRISNAFERRISL